jgi:RNA methyltransferase, TrmH family
MPQQLKSLKWYRQLADKKGRDAAGVFLVEGEKAIRQVMAARPDDVLEIVSVEKPPAFSQSYLTRSVSASEFRYISSSQTPQGIMAVVRQPEDIYSPTLPANPGKRILLLEDIQDPGNTGTLIRTAAALQYDGVILTGSSADPLSPKCVQAGAGTVLSVWLRRTAQYLDLAEKLKEQGFFLAAADVKGNASPDVLSQKEKLVLALGNEAAGLSGKILTMADGRVRIPIIAEKAESLNVAVSGGILMYLSREK